MSNEIKSLKTEKKPPYIYSRISVSYSKQKQNLWREEADVCDITNYNLLLASKIILSIFFSTLMWKKSIGKEFCIDNNVYYHFNIVEKSDDYHVSAQL